jgi:hypothetical protein
MGFMAFPGGTITDSDQIHDYLVKYDIQHDPNAPAPFITSSTFGCVQKYSCHQYNFFFFKKL